MGGNRLCYTTRALRTLGKAAPAFGVNWPVLSTSIKTLDVDRGCKSHPATFLVPICGALQEVKGSEVLNAGIELHKSHQVLCLCLKY